MSMLVNEYQCSMDFVFRVNPDNFEEVIESLEKTRDCGGCEVDTQGYIDYCEDHNEDEE